MPFTNIAIYDEGQTLPGLGNQLFRFSPVLPGYQPNEIVRVTSVADMVTKVMLAMQGRREKFDIYFNGVGKANYQSVGAGSTVDPSGERSLQLDANGELNNLVKPWLLRLVGRVRAIHLLGIEDGGWSGKTDSSFPLIHALASMLNDVHIYGQVGEGSHLFYFSNQTHPRIVTRTSAERQLLRESLKKLDQQ